MQDTKTEDVKGEGEAKYQGIDPAFHECVDKYGRDMVALVINAGMAGQAMQVLGGLVTKHRSQHSMHALQVLGGAYNALSNYYVEMKGWTEEMVVQCDRDCQLAWAAKIQVPGSPVILMQ